MILTKIILKNFRQFKQEQRIIFASETDRKNVTVIFGESGSGKSSILRAIVFCLWGDRVLSNDLETENYRKSIANISALEESNINGEPVETVVCLDFEHKEKKYSLKRAILTTKRDKTINDTISEVVLNIADRSGNQQSLSEPEDISTVINSVFDSNVREFFLFNTETITAFTKILCRENPMHYLMPMCDSQLSTYYYMIALAKSFLAEKKYELPLIMDTPCERLSSEHRKIIIASILQERFQVILLTSPEELQGQVTKLLRQSGRLGLCYFLESKENGATIIELANLQKIEHHI